MKILCHRGYWKQENEKNTLGAIKAAFASGRGIESDIRDYMGELVISHNSADADSPKAEKVFAMMKEYGDKYCFAINIKADGVNGMLKDYLTKYAIDNYFTFDMSLPQMLEYRSMGIRYFTRQSEYEPKPALYEDAAGVWVDAFEDAAWITQELIAGHQKQEKTVCIVSPDLHQKENEPFWARLISYDIQWDKLILCTDCPDEACEYFKEKGTDR